MQNPFGIGCRARGTSSRSIDPRARRSGPERVDRSARSYCVNGSVTETTPYARDGWVAKTTPYARNSRVTETTPYARNSRVAETTPYARNSWVAETTPYARNSRVTETTPRHPDTSWATPSPADSLVAHGRLVRPSHALMSTPSAAHEARATAVGVCDRATPERPWRTRPRDVEKSADGARLARSPQAALRARARDERGGEATERIGWGGCGGNWCPDVVRS